MTPHAAPGPRANPSGRRRTLWLCFPLAAGILWGAGTLVLRLQPYLIAKYWGERADLRGAVLLYAPLAEANLERADLQEAVLRGADLRNANLSRANLAGADLRGADLRGARIGQVEFARAAARMAAEYATLRTASQRLQPSEKLGGSRRVEARVRHRITDRMAVLARVGVQMRRLASQFAPQLRGVVYDRHTRWPAGFDPRRYGARAAD